MCGVGVIRTMASTAAVDLAPAPPRETAVLLLKPPDPDYVDMHVLDSITKEEILRNWIPVACSAKVLTGMRIPILSVYIMQYAFTQVRTRI